MAVTVANNTGQKDVGTTGNAFDLTSITMGATNSVVVGNGNTSSNQAPCVITDDGSNSYTQLNGQTGIDRPVSIDRDVSVNAGATLINIASGLVGSNAHGYEFAGTDTTGTIQTDTHYNGFTSSVTFASVTPPSSDGGVFIVSGMSAFGGSTYTPDNGSWTVTTTVVDGVHFMTAYTIVTTGAAFNPSGSWDGTAELNSVMVFIPAAAAGGVPSRLTLLGVG